MFIHFVKTYWNLDLSKIITSLGYKIEIVYYNKGFITIMISITIVITIVVFYNNGCNTEF